MDTPAMFSAPPKLMRDVVIDKIHNAARKDKDILFISADLGAAALDDFRSDLPDQVIFAGVSEQNMVDLASGLALSDKKVFLYGMAPFITARCYEQVKCVIASMHLPVTLIGVGVGLGYDHATLTHFTPEDVACMRSLNGIEILSPSDEESATIMATEAINNPAFRYIRLERKPQDHIYHGEFTKALERGFAQLGEGRDVAIVACGYMLHKALKAQKILADKGVSAGVIDLFRIKRVNVTGLSEILARYNTLLTVEEQQLEGGFGSAVVEALVDRNSFKPVKRLGIRDGFVVVNGDRDTLHDLYGIDTPHIVEAALTLRGS